MPFFRYSVQDKSGQTLDGTISAKTPDEASFALTQRGYRVLNVQDIRPAAKVVPPPVKPVPIPKPAPMPVAAPRPHPDVVKTKPSSDKALFFLFSQLASQLRSGVNPATGLNTLAKQQRHPGVRTSLEDMARSIAAGESMSAVMERYPYVYPPDVVGVVRSGELGGFLPEACAAVAAQKEASHRLARRLRLFSLIVIIILCQFPLVLAIVDASLATIKEQDAAGGSLPPVETLMRQISHSIPAVLPGTLLATAVLLAALVGWNSMPMRTLRHSLALYLPVFAGRARAEAMARFAWTMQLLSRAGLPPFVVFKTAASTIPNVVLRDRMVRQAEGLSENVKLSEALQQARVLPEEHEMIVANGELVGDVPGALATVASAHDSEFRARDGTLVYKFGCILYPAIGLMLIVMMYFLYTRFYMGIFKAILPD